MEAVSVSEEVGRGDKQCAVCYEPVTDDPADALKHYLEEHPNSDVLAEIVESIEAVVECAECEKEFATGLQTGLGNIGAPAYCPACEQERYHRKLFLQTFTAEEFLKLRRRNCADANGGGNGD